MYETNDKMVSHPAHYQSETGLEVIDVIEAFTFDLKGIEATDTGNILKYMCRWKQKNGLQDLKKAMWYLTHLIEHVEKDEKVNQEDIPNVPGDGANLDAKPVPRIHFTTRGEAEDILNKMKELVDTIGVATISDFIELTGGICVYLDTQYGWYNLHGAAVFCTQDGYVIDFPKVKKL